MRAMIFSASVGSGHNQVAKATAQEIQRRYPDAVVEIRDVIKTISPFLSRILLESYLGMLRHMPEIWGLIHDQFNRENPDRPPLRLTNRLLTNELKKCIEDFRPDVIINTHAFASNLMGVLRSTGDLECPAVSIITDYNVHAFWVHQGIDRFYLAHEHLADYLNDLGVPHSHIRCYGIPVRNQFSHAKAALGKTGSAQGSKYANLLFMGGGLGLGDIFQVLENTDKVMEDAQLVVVCGRNEKLFYEIRNHTWNNAVLPLKFVDNIAEVMSQADVIITKPGGVTCTEALVLGKPLALISPIPGQEILNLQFFLNLGVAITIPSNQFAGHVLKSLVESRERQAIMRNQAFGNSNINAAADIVSDINLIIEQNALDTDPHKW